MIIGLTGGIASGKTTVARFLEELGARVISADDISREIMQKGKPVWQKIIKEFGNKILKESGEIDRFRLGKMVFRDNKKLRLLEKITHPHIIAEMKRRVIEIQQESKNKWQTEKNDKIIEKPVIILEIPLLFEAGLTEMVDQVWVVFVDCETQLERIINRDGLNKKEARQRIQAQIPLARKKELADVVIDNRDSQIELRQKVSEVWQQKIMK